MLKKWILHPDSPYDFNNGGEAEADNLGQTLYLLSLFTDSTHPLVKQIKAETKKYGVNSNGIRYIKGQMTERIRGQTKRRVLSFRLLIQRELCVSQQM